MYVVDETREVSLQRRGKLFHGWPKEEPTRPLWVHRIVQGELFDDDRAHLEHANRISSLTEVAACPFILGVHVADVQAGVKSCITT